jgi:hypothetical protein
VSEKRSEKVKDLKPQAPKKEDPKMTDGGGGKGKIHALQQVEGPPNHLTQDGLKDRGPHTNLIGDTEENTYLSPYINYEQRRRRLHRLQSQWSHL